MAQASFFINNIRVIKQGQYLILEARRVCPHGTVFDEVLLTMPAECESLFAKQEQSRNKSASLTNTDEQDSLKELFARFSKDKDN